MKYIFFLCTAVILFLVMAGCTQTAQQGQPATTAAPSPVDTATAAPVITPTASVSDNTIVIQNMAYNPAQITVKAGSIVRWVNKDKVPHSVVFSKDSMIDPSGILAISQSFSVKFNNAGIYNYSCSIHPVMQGSVVVT